MLSRFWATARQHVDFESPRKLKYYNWVPSEFSGRIFFFFFFIFFSPRIKKERPFWRNVRRGKRAEMRQSAAAPPPPRLRRYFATRSVVVSKPRVSARLRRLDGHVRYLRALNEHHFPEAERESAAARDRAAAAAREKAQREAVQVLTDPDRDRHLAATIRALMHMKEYFSDGIEGGIFTTRSEDLVAKAIASSSSHDDRENQHPLFFILESLNAAYDDPSLLHSLPKMRADVVSRAHHLPGADDTYFDRFMCRTWVDQIKSYLDDLLSPLERLPLLLDKARKHQAWSRLKGDPLRRALRLARVGRLIYLLHNQRYKIDLGSMRRAWGILKRLFFRCRRIEAEFTRRRQRRTLARCWECWEEWVHQRVWIGIEEMSVARGLHVIELLWRRRQYLRGLRMWLRVSAWVARKRELEWQRRIQQRYFAVWLEWVEDVRRLRGRKAYNMLLQTIGRRNAGSNARRAAITADRHYREILMRKVWRAFLEMMLSRERLRGMVVAALERMAGQYLGMAFLVWARAVQKMRQAQRRKRVKVVKPREPERCHMCLHVACPKTCLYLAERRAMRRSAWRFIEL